MPQLENLPAMIYTLIWPLKIDRRLESATRNQRLRILFKFLDFPPAALLDINDGSFVVKAVDIEETLESIEADVEISGFLNDLTEMLARIKKSLKTIVTRKIKIKNLRKALKLLKILGIKEIKLKEDQILRDATNE
jgi:hypothetical protein